MSRDYNVSNTYQDYVYSSRETFASILAIMDRQEETLSRIVQRGTVGGILPPGDVDIATLSFIIDTPSVLSVPSVPSVNTRVNGLTSEMISEHTRTVIFSSIEDPINTSCPIARDDFEPDTEVIQIIGCGHLFTPSNLEEWFHRHHDCPMCRHDIPQTPVNSPRPRPPANTNRPTPTASPASNVFTNALISQFTNLLNANLDGNTNDFPNNPANRR